MIEEITNKLQNKKVLQRLRYIDFEWNDDKYTFEGKQRYGSWVDIATNKKLKVKEFEELMNSGYSIKDITHETIANSECVDTNETYCSCILETVFLEKN